jgi:phosphoribosyl 1,2-cyclic phosphodiesterase
LRFCSLGSGSSGNATLVESVVGTRTTRLLIDCGMPYKHLAERLAKRGLGVADLDAVFVTHEHSDHVGCARQLAAHEHLAVWMSRGTFMAMGGVGQSELEGRICFAQDGDSIAVGDFHLLPFTVAHDAKEPLQLTLAVDQQRFGLLTDLGHVTPYTLAQMQNLDAVVLEFNHDEALLRTSKYPPFLKDRIAGNYGHLSNIQAAILLEAISHKGLRHVVAAHLSEQNNSPERVREVIDMHRTGFAYQVHVADAEDGFDWIEI